MPPSKRKGVKPTQIEFSTNSKPIEVTRKSNPEKAKLDKHTLVKGIAIVLLSFVCWNLICVLKAPNRSFKSKEPQAEVDEAIRNCCYATELFEDGDSYSFSNLVNACRNHAFKKDGLVVLTQVTRQIQSFSRYSVALNAAWASTFGHSLVVEEELPPAVRGKREFRFGKVWFLMQVMEKLVHNTAQESRPAYVLWIDADAVILNLQDDVVMGAAQKHLGVSGTGAQAHVVVGREMHGGVATHQDLPTTTNTGTLLLRVGPWALALLQAWWAHPTALQGKADQVVWDRLWAENHLDIRAKTVLLPSEALNGGVGTFTSPLSQPVLHLFGLPLPARLQIFGDLVRRQCAMSSEESLRGEGGEGEERRGAPGQWEDQVGGLVLGAYLSSLNTTMKELEGTPDGHKAAFKFADGLVRFADLCEEEQTGCLSGAGLPSSAAAARQQALGVYRELEAAMSRVSHHPREAAALQDKIAHLLQTTGEVDEALVVWQGVVDMLRRAGPAAGSSATLQLAAALNRQAVVLQSVGRYQEALPAAEKALQVWEGLMGPDHHDLKRLLMNLAAIHESLDDPIKADALRDRASTIY